jgi:putative ABC transport system ATP-binding protein
LNVDSGTVNIFGQETTTMSDRALTRFRAKNIGFVFQQYNLLPALTAAENAAIPLVIAGWSKQPAVKKASEILSAIGMGKKTNSLPSQLSGGQMQRVAIARALSHEPRLLVCDEPTAALDHDTGITVMELLREVAVRPDRAVVVVTHDNRVFGFGDRIAHMDDGSLVCVDERTVKGPAIESHPG